MTTETYTSEKKKYTLFETGVIGFFVGVIVAAYLTFITSTGGFLGTLLSWVSLQPLVPYFNIPDSELLIVSFVFIVLVYTVYGVILGAIIKTLAKPRRIIVPTIILLGAIVAEQAIGTTRQLTVASDTSQDAFSQTAAAIISLVRTKAAKPPYDQQYFGTATTTEATGDLNGDGKADIAFLIHRDDPDRGVLYYLSAAIATTTGHTGADLLFLGDKVVPHTISIADGIIDVAYTVGAATTTRDFYFDLVGGNLQKTSVPAAATSTATTTASTTVTSI